MHSLVCIFITASDYQLDRCK